MAALPVAKALENLKADVGDRILQQDDFAEYTTQGWVGSIGSMQPGQSFLYFSKTEKSFTYSTATSAPAVSRQQTVVQPENAWQYDAHRYPDVTSVVAQLCTSLGQPLQEESLPRPLQKESLPRPLQKEGRTAYAVGAFCGDECRGIGRWVDNVLFLSVHGQQGDLITFRAYDAETGATLPIYETLLFDADCHGSLSEPMPLTLPTDVTTIYSAASEGKAFDIYTTGGQLVRRNATSLKGLPTGIYIVGGQKMVVQ
jgi:hypothetical protein